MASIELADLQPEDDAAMASRLTCKEYVALVVMQVVENMDAIAWARVERPIRGAELAQTLENAEEHVVGGARPSQFPDSDGAADLQSLGTLRKIPDTVKLTDLEELASFYSDSVRANPFTKDLTLFFERQKADDDDIGMRGWAPADKRHSERRRECVAALQDQLFNLRRSSSNQDFITQCMHDQKQAFSHSVDEVEALDVPDDDEIPIGDRTSKLDDVAVAWQEPAPNTLTPSQYLRAYLKVLPPETQPTDEQLAFLALFASRLDVVKQEEEACKPWSERSQFIILLMGQGGCGKTYVVQNFVARVVKCPAIRGFQVGGAERSMWRRSW